MSAYSVEPLAGPLSARVVVPGSKSVANRALVCAALAGGESELDNLPPGDDTAAMLGGLQLLGVGIEATGRADSVVVRGLGSPTLFRPGPVTLPARLAGTTSRFLTALAAAGPGPYTVDGEPSLRTRPMTPLHDALVTLGATVRPTGEWGHLPVTVSGPIGGDRVAVRGDVSSQYITALMLVAPTLTSGLRIELTTPLVSRSYLGITSSVMAAFGVEGVEISDDVVTVPAGTYGATRYGIEPDASSAGYPLAAAAIAGGQVHVPGLTAASLQGDARFAALLGAMGCEVTLDDTGVTVARHGRLHGIDVDMNDLSDLVPTLAVVAAFGTSTTTIRGVGFIRRKESDRLGDLAAELRRAGIDAAETDDGLVIRPSEVRPARFGTHHDHRLAMALALIGLVVPGVEIDDPGVVSKSWPGYWRMLEDLG
ncbi:MAG: 3-phosphoshikimate 1-carboxyvinyltransferase [Ilumatobacteraceae bacterium]